MNVHWTWDDLRIVGDIVLGSLLAGGLRLIVLKAFIEPAAVFFGQRAYRQAGTALGDQLPDFFGKQP